MAWFYSIPGFFIGLITNTFVHVAMYLYFALQFILPDIKKFGKYITIIQLTQFNFCVAIGIPLVLYSLLIDRCTVHNGPALMWVLFIYASYLVLFVKFDNARRRLSRSPDKSLKPQPIPMTNLVTLQAAAAEQPPVRTSNPATPATIRRASRTPTRPITDGPTINVTTTLARSETPTKAHGVPLTMDRRCN